MSKYAGFNSVELRKPKRAVFDLSHEKRLSTKLGRLTPIFISETLPNDTFRVNSEVLLRFAPLLAPIMHQVNVWVHYFFVPNRLLWKDWEAFITNGRLGTETPPVPPNGRVTLILGNNEDLLDKGSNADYLGMRPIPDSAGASWTGRFIDLMPFAAAYRAWYDYYRDRNYVADNTILPLPSGIMATNATLQELLKPRYRDWEHDYFTSALPWTQRGDEVLMPLVGSGDVTYLDNSLVYDSDTDNPVNTDNLLGTDLSFPTGSLRYGDANMDATFPARIENIDEVSITNSAVSINDLRRATALQTWLERNALAGSRYNEAIWAHFARKTSDARIQQAEYLGGGKVSVKISEVLTTAYSQDAGDETVPPGNMAGRGISLGSSNRFTYNCEEHGFVVGFMSIMPTSGYMQGTHRMFLQRNTFLDYPFPAFAHLGEQPVYDYEIYSDDVSIPANRPEAPIFGYQSRYADWKYIASSAHGDFRDTMDFWHLTREFTSQPVLGATFTNFDTNLEARIFAVSGVDTCWCYIHNACTVKRSLPYFGTPRLQ